MRILKINELISANNNIGIAQKSHKNHNVATNTINSTNINAMNFGNKSLISFNGYYETLQENYFNLPITEID